MNRLRGEWLYRLSREERLTVRMRGGRKQALGIRSPMQVQQDANQRWSLNFVSDKRRFPLCVIDDSSRESLATTVANSISGERVAREFDIIA